MIFRWFRQRRRRRILQTPFPDDWTSTIARNVLLSHWLPADLSGRLRQLTRVFATEKNWEGCGGLELTDEMRVTISALACLLIVGLDQDYYDHVSTILVYPDAYLATQGQTTPSGIVNELGEPRLGEAWWRGPVIVSWRGALAGGRRRQPGHNLVLHEFAHQLDMLNGHIVDGTPPLHSADAVARWIQVMEPAYQRLIRDCRSGRPGLVNCYGTTNRGEFFAVLTEAFFDQPQVLQHRHPAVYSVLREFYRVDPAKWERRPDPPPASA